jgi:hypothetical protein
MQLAQAKEYLRGLAEMDRQYYASAGERLCAGLRLKVQKKDQTPENEAYHSAFLPLEAALRHPQLLTIRGVYSQELKKAPGHGKFVVGPGKVVERQKGERAPTAAKSGCAGVLLVIAAIAALGTWLLCSSV